MYSKQYTPKEREIKTKTKTKQNNTNYLLILFLNINFYSVKKAAKGPWRNTTRSTDETEDSTPAKH